MFLLIRNVINFGQGLSIWLLSFQVLGSNLSTYREQNYSLHKLSKNYQNHEILKVERKRAKWYIHTNILETENLM